MRRFELTAEIRRALLAGLSGGGSLTNLAPLCGCSREVLGRAIAAAPGLAVEVAKAKAKGAIARRAAKASRAPAHVPPALVLVPPAPAPRPMASAEKASRDTRPVVREAQVLAAIPAAAEAMRGPLTPANMPGSPPRWGVHEAWTRLRAAFHATTPDAVRRECLARLVCEENDRIAHDEGASMHRPGSIGFSRRGED